LGHRGSEPGKYAGNLPATTDETFAHVVFRHGLPEGIGSVGGGRPAAPQSHLPPHLARGVLAQIAQIEKENEKAVRNVSGTFFSLQRQ
jgi:hypothetical protein